MSSKSNASSSSLADMIGNVIDYKKLDVIDYLRSVALLAVFLVLVFKTPASGRGSFFAIGDVLGTGMCGLACYFFPVGYISHKIEGELDIGLQYSTQACGAILIGLAWMRYRCVDSRDAYCSVSHIIIRILGAVMMLIAQLQAQYGISGSHSFTVLHLVYSTFPCFLWLLVQVIELCRYSGEGKRAYGALGGNRRDLHLLIAAIVTISFSLCHIGFPDAVVNQILKFTGSSPTEIHFYFAKAFGLLTLMVGLHFMAALTFETDSDKKATLEGVLVINGLMFPLAILHQLKHQIFNCPYFFLASSFVMFLNALWGHCDSTCALCTRFCNIFSGKTKAKRG